MKLKSVGTDGCKTCETGRVTMFIANERCMDCDPKSYEPTSAIEILKAQLAETNPLLAEAKVILANDCPFNCYYEGRHPTCDSEACEFLRKLEGKNG